MYEAYCKTPVGFAYIIANDNFVIKVSIRDEEQETAPVTHPLLLEAIKQLNEYFAGDRKVFDLPLQQPGSDFQQQVWQQLLQIDYGKTITYGQQSNLMKNPLAIRAIAAANGKNNLWVIVPCHRVVSRNGDTKYSGGARNKNYLLALESGRS